MSEKDFKDLNLMTQITCENGKIYLLYSDGNLYEKAKDGRHKKLDGLNSENAAIIKKIMERLRPAPTDVVNERVSPVNAIKESEDIIIVADEPEL